MRSRVALTVDLIGNAAELARLLGVLNDFGLRGTFLVTLNPPPPHRSGQEDQVRMLVEGKHEICNHTYSHPFNLTWLSPEEMEKEIVTAHEALVKLCNQYTGDVKIKGFRAPAQVFDERVFPVLSKMGYTWDSSRVFFPALLRPFKISRYGQIVEIPTLFPNDSALIDRYHLAPEEILRLFRESFEASRKYFVFTVHPYVIARDDESVGILERFLRFMQKNDSEFLLMSEMAESLGTMA